MPDALVGPVGDKAGTYFYSRVNRRSNPTMTPAATVTAARAEREGTNRQLSPPQGAEARVTRAVQSNPTHVRRQ